MNPSRAITLSEPIVILNISLIIIGIRRTSADEIYEIFGVLNTVYARWQILQSQMQT